ncbi:Crp/Fnr family transcriptional regulator [Salmonirosea aquatica]|uniref:Crp/Fnr family transcriptional regulator n=1 Tax=Salmonirosea aquatica TaxID=2654236 RepID=UPI003570F3F4
MENLIFDFIARYMPLSEEEKQAVIDLALIRTCKKGTVLLSEGHPAREGYLVLRGCLRSYYIIDGEDKTTSFYTEFEFFAPAGLVTHKPSQQYLACLEDCILAVGNPDMEKVMFKSFPVSKTYAGSFPSKYWPGIRFLSMISRPPPPSSGI